MRRFDSEGLWRFGGHGHLEAAFRLWSSFLLMILLSGLPAEAQEYLWSRLVGGPGNSIGLSIASDGDGNVFLGGQFDGTMTFGADFVATSQFSTDAYVAKLSPSGVPVWIVQIGDVGDDTLKSIATDQAGNVVAAGRTAGGAIFLTLLDGEDGSVRWSRNITGDDQTVADGVAVDGSGNVVLAAGFRGSADFGGAALTSAGSYDLALASYDGEDGSHLWSRRFGGAGDELADAVGVGPGNVIAVVGNFSTTTDLGAGSHSTNGLSDIFVATYSTSDGAPIWSKTLGGTGFDAAHGVALDAEGNVLVTGYFGQFGGPVDFGGGSIASNGGADLFLVKYDASGAYQWSRTAGGLGDDSGYGITVDSAGNPTVTGSFQLSIDFGGGSHASAGQIDSFVVHYGNNGQYDWSHTYGSIATDKGFAVATDPDNQLLATGFALWNIDFGGGTLINAGYSDAYVVKLGSDLPAPTPTPTPSPTPQETPSGNCPASPDTSCVAGFQKGMFLVRNAPGKERLIAKMLKGPALEQTDVGNPLESSRGGSGTSFSLCIYDENGIRVGDVTVDRAGEICANGKHCWRPVGRAPTDPKGPGKGYSYSDKTLAADGVARIMYRGGASGRSKVILKAKGPNLPADIAQLIEGSSRATLQLRSSNGICLSLSLSGGDRLFNRVN